MKFHDYMHSEHRVIINEGNVSIMRDDAVCIGCGSCRLICHDYVGVHGYYSPQATHGIAVCTKCGQCANVCPPNSITEVYDYKKVQEALDDPEKIVIFSTAPSVRVSLGEEFQMEDGSYVQGKLVTLLRELGADYVLDVDFGADMVIMEESKELLERIHKGTGPLPQYTSCCPAWVEYAEIFHPEILPHISTCKSPIGMLAPTVKTYFAKKMRIDPKKIVNVAVTPCTAKKYEITWPEMTATQEYYKDRNMRDMDYIITTRELGKWAIEKGIEFQKLEDGVCDRWMGETSGGGALFGDTGGVMESVLRQAYLYSEGKKLPKKFYDLKAVRGLKEVKEATVKIGDMELNVAVIYGTRELTRFLDEMKRTKKTYHFIEVMNCPGGCIGGGGQPKDILFKGEILRAKRIAGLHREDRESEIRVSGENPEIVALYRDFYDHPGSELAQKMLHTTYRDKSSDLGY